MGSISPLFQIISDIEIINQIHGSLASSSLYFLSSFPFYLSSKQTIRAVKQKRKIGMVLSSYDRNIHQYNRKLKMFSYLLCYQLAMQQNDTAVTINPKRGGERKGKIDGVVNKKQEYIYISIQHLPSTLNPRDLALLSATSALRAIAIPLGANKASKEE